MTELPLSMFYFYAVTTMLFSSIFLDLEVDRGFSEGLKEPRCVALNRWKSSAALLINAILMTDDGRIVLPCLSTVHALFGIRPGKHVGAHLVHPGSYHPAAP